ncbi:FAD-binding protein [Massilia arenosa]|uniref:FAD-binding protein n=1 Tax=Zemynaea arenosa TaxID=2561931 RepID=A0A4Y9RRP9_9BURK|nr:FAD-linked oxidase C-terminal domain-containing protein [Massilia arenosa]TFW10635.1 FAD-binding protein [Massilia arenosa]
MPSDLPLAERRHSVAAALRARLPERVVLSDPEDTRPYECDGLAAYRQLPMIVTLPENEEQVVTILNVCRELGVRIVPRGAGTGLSGGAMPISDGVVVSTARLNRIVRMDPYARVAVVQPGVRNLAISEAAAPHGLYYAPDPSSQIACTIGGNVAENSGGVHCLKYGLTVHNVLRVRVATIEGDVVELGGEALDAPGLDLLSVFIGSEGMLGIVTEVTVKLVPKPAQARVIMASFDDVVTGANAVASVIAAGIIPAGLEMMDRTSSRMVEPFVHAGYDTDAAAILLCEADGTELEVEEEIGRMSAVLEDAGASAIAVSRSEAERLKFWSGRKNAFPAAGRISPDYYCMDGTIPRKNLAQVLRGIERMEQEFGLRCANVFHAGDGNLHPLILFDANKPDEFERAEAFGAAILALCVEVGGTITGEHGVGIEKIGSMCIQFTRAELDTFFAVKRAFDVSFLLNPDKAIPTLHRCAEFGRMHVSKGQLPFADLPRF